jgi:hypothetical protein
MEARFKQSLLTSRLRCPGFKQDLQNLSVALPHCCCNCKTSEEFLVDISASTLPIGKSNLSVLQQRSLKDWHHSKSKFLLLCFHKNLNEFNNKKTKLVAV